MNKRTLLINNDYSPLTFLNERRVYKFLALDKVEVLSYWDDRIKFSDSYMNFPAVMKLKHQIKRSYKPVNYSKNVLIRRDNKTCQYCARTLDDSEITVDHLLPKCKGGKTTFTNCVVSCLVCNSFKGSKSLEESGLKLLKQPIQPVRMTFDPFFHKISTWHEDWNFYKQR